ncbi:MAG: (Fe-S)-binding protein [Deltaproteobacteria bacterium]|nr:(Fe-S)-binding protein [Deltaproteobacteria bacterium]
METVAPLKEIVAEIQQAGGAAYRYCYQCGKCDVVCPWNRVRAFSMRKLIREATFGLTEIEHEELWRCTTCGTCPTQCPRGVQQIEVGVSLRRIATGYGVFPSAVRGVRTAAGSLVAEGNPLGEPRAKRDAWASGLPVKPFAEGMEVLYFVGCYYSHDPRLKKVAVAIAKILDRAKVDFGILGTAESCCGEAIRKTGNEEVFRALAKSNIKTFVERGVKKILVASPHCFHTLKNEYREFMAHFEVVHFTQFLKQLLDEGRLELSGEFPHRVTYHDPCYLGRHNGIYDAPREVLGRVPGLELVEMADHHQDSLCCGGGGGRIWMETPKQDRFSELRLQQAQQVDADVLATACPYCTTMFEDSRLSLPEDAKLEIKDLAEIVAQAI